MKVSIIGSNKNSADFLKPCEIVENPTDADVIIFDGNFNYRSAITKLNKLNKKQLIISFNGGIDFFANKYNYKIITVKQRKINATIPVRDNRYYIREGLFDKVDKIIIPNKNHTCVCQSEFYSNFNCVQKLSPLEDSFVNADAVYPIIYMQSEKYPNLLFVQLDINKFPESSLSQFIKNYICEYLTTH